MAEYISFQPSDFFSTLLYSGTGSSNAVTGVGFQPAMTWIKSYDTVVDHALYDAVRGVERVMYPNTDDADAGASTGLTAFGADGFTVVSEGNVNNGSREYASWNWKAGTTSGLTGGTITPSSYSFNATSGFGVYKFTGTGANANIAHGLGKTPKFIIIKNTTDADDWTGYHQHAGNNSFMVMNTSAAEGTGSTLWNDTTPTSTLFYLGANGKTNASAANMMAYVFADVPGYSKFGGYDGNGDADGPYIYTGFKPAYVMAKRIDSTGYWRILNTKMDTSNPAYHVLFANATDAQGTTPGGTQYDTDFLSNGFKIRTSIASSNANGGRWLYAAFAESPIVSSNDIPTVAR